MTVKQLTRERITENHKRLKELDKNSDEYKQALKETLEMTDRYVELEKITTESKNKNADRELDAKRRKHEIVIEGIKNGAIIATAVMSTCLAVWGTRKTFEFEIDYTPTPTLGREYFRKLVSKK